MQKNKLSLFLLSLSLLGIFSTTRLATALAASAIPDGTTIIAEGDSITAGYHLNAGEDWPSILMTTPNFAGKGEKYNFSVSSSEVDWLAGRYDSKVYPLRPQAGEKAILFVLAGTNDILVEDQSAAEVYNELQNYWQRAKNDGFEVWAFTLMERSNFTPAERAEAQELNRLIRESTVWDRLVDISPLFPDPANTSLFLDGIHPTALGNTKIAQFVNDLASTGSSYTQASAQTLSIKQLFATGGIGIGTITPQEALDVSGNILASGRLTSSSLLVQSSTGTATARILGDGQPAGLFIDRFISNVNSGVIQLRKGRGSAASPGEVLKGDSLGGISFWGYKNGGFQLSSYITGEVDGDPNGANLPSSINFYTKNSAGNLNLGLKIDKDGAVSMPAVYNASVSGARDLLVDSKGKIGYISSSARYKEDITNIPSTEWLYDLRPVSFEYIADKTNTQQLGLIAEEVEEVVQDAYPDLISYSATNPTQVETVNYSKLIVPLLNETQELNTRVHKLELTNWVEDGQSTMKARQPKVFVATTAVSDGDLVAIYPIYKENLLNKVGLVQLYRGEIVPGKGFYVHVAPANLPEDLSFDWAIKQR